MYRLSGPTALAETINTALDDHESQSQPRPTPIFIFDFDRTLTNGISFPGEPSLDKLVRGGTSTTAALLRAKLAGCPLYIITARRPSTLTVEQIFASLDHAQSALSPFFERGPPASLIVADLDEPSHKIPLARGGNIFAADYQKAAALAQIIREQAEPTKIYFFDDAIVNSFVVAEHLDRHLRGHNFFLFSYWWDTFEEECGPTPTMTPSHTSSTDSSYAEHLSHMLLAFGIDSNERERRIGIYESLQRGKSRVGRVAGDLKGAGKLQKNQPSIGLLENVLGERFCKGPSDGYEAMAKMKKKKQNLPLTGWRANVAEAKIRAEAAVAMLPSSVVNLPR